MKYRVRAYRTTVCSGSSRRQVPQAMARRSSCASSSRSATPTTVQRLRSFVSPSVPSVPLPRNPPPSPCMHTSPGPLSESYTPSPSAHPPRLFFTPPPPPPPSRRRPPHRYMSPSSGIFHTSHAGGMCSRSGMAPSPSSWLSVASAYAVRARTTAGGATAECVMDVRSVLRGGGCV
jgi:hypothetical protein